MGKTNAWNLTGPFFWLSVLVLFRTWAPITMVGIAIHVDPLYKTLQDFRAEAEKVAYYSQVSVQ